MLHNCWWKELFRKFAVLGLLEWRNIIVVCDVIQSLVRCLFYLLHFTWYMTKMDTDSLLIGLQMSSSACLFYSDILWNCHVDLEGNLNAGRQGRTTGEPSSLLRSMELCSNNSRFSCVERWCTPDEKNLQVSIHVFCSWCRVTKNV